MEQTLTALLQFIKEAEGLKSVLRTAWSSAGRRESTAEHSWRLALMALVISPNYPRLDREKLLALCLVHDLGELYDGDISAALLPDETKKHRAEQRAAEKLFSLLPFPQSRELTALWKEYNEGVTPEAMLIKALDKAETILQHNQGSNPDGFDYDFNLKYGAAYFTGDPFLESLRAELDRQTKIRIQEKEAPTMPAGYSAEERPD